MGISKESYKCVPCLTGYEPVAPEMARLMKFNLSQRVWNKLALDGVARIGCVRFKDQELAVDEWTTTPNQARQIFSDAVRAVGRVWVATHVRDLNRYVLGHLKETGSRPCRCRMS